MNNILEQAEAICHTKSPKAIVTWNDGTTSTLRLFKSITGLICYKAPRRRKYGYTLNPYDIKMIIPKNSHARKTDEQKWIDGWNKVLAKLQASGLWENVVNEINIALKMGYDRIRKANDFYWTLPYGEYTQFFELYPELVCINDENVKYVNTTVLWNYSKMPIVKKMRFQTRNYDKLILESIATEMKEKISSSHHGRTNYDVSFEYNAEKNRAFYSEEFKGCVNGHYYIALNATHALFVEDD
jgi:hypothetical protein